MSEAREHAHELIERVPETQVVALVEFLETMVDPVAAALANAPIDDEPEIQDETLAVQEAQHSLARNWL